MTFELITDVPAALSEFYFEEIRSEPTGNTVAESFTYFDENGVEQTGSRQVPEYADVAYVVQVTRPQMVSWDKVDSIIDKHQGKRDTVVDRFIMLAVDTERWEFFDEYHAYLTEKAEIELYNATQQFDEEGEPITFELREIPAEPVFLASGSDKIALVKNAKFKRDNGQHAEITVAGITFDCDAISYDKMKGTITSWDTLIADQTLIDLGMVVDGKLGWTDSSNTVQFVTQAELQAVVDAVAVRAALLQAEYTAAKA